MKDNHLCAGYKEIAAKLEAYKESLSDAYIQIDELTSIITQAEEWMPMQEMPEDLCEKVNEIIGYAVTAKEKGDD